MATAIALRLRVNNSRASCRLINSFSTSGPKPQDEENTAESPPPSQTSKHTSFIDGLISKLHKQPHNRSSGVSVNSNSSTVSNLEGIASSFSEFHLRTAPPPPSGADPTDPLSLEESYKRNLAGPKSSNPVRKDEFFILDEIQKKVRQEKQYATPAAVLFSQMSANNINPRNLSKAVFEKESAEADKVKFISYSHKELGKRLMDLRPEEAKGSNKSFSLEELNKRLMKLRENDRNRPACPASYNNMVRHSINEIAVENPPSITRAVSVHTDFLTPNYMKKPPKEDLVERYFHPDNMSSAEKMKLELQKVRDEFKMSESDCGSSRVQVATLTTKIKHLSTTLHKKDKHSRKGLQAMVQKRKKLLKYMRRTDWDSYCLVLSKLGLRDNPDYKS
jgi:ribosomal protein S15